MHKTCDDIIREFYPDPELERKSIPIKGNVTYYCGSRVYLVGVTVVRIGRWNKRVAIFMETPPMWSVFSDNVRYVFAAVLYRKPTYDERVMMDSGPAIVLQALEVCEQTKSRVEFKAGKKDYWYLYKNQ